MGSCTILERLNAEGTVIQHSESLDNLKKVCQDAKSENLLYNEKLIKDVFCVPESKICINNMSELKEYIRDHQGEICKNLSKILHHITQHITCNKCQIHGSIKVIGSSTALSIFADENHDHNLLSMIRIVSIFHSVHGKSIALHVTSNLKTLDESQIISIKNKGFQKEILGA
ncbi:MAG: hypothetical protein MHPSP_004627 [Paramarteilia canceri]